MGSFEAMLGSDRAALSSDRRELARRSAIPSFRLDFPAAALSIFALRLQPSTASNMHQTIDLVFMHESLVYA